MNRFARTLLFATTLCLVALFVLKLVVEHRVNSALDDAIAGLSLFGYATYDDVEVNLWGSKVSIADLEIDPYDDQYPTVRADLWSVELPDGLLFEQVLGFTRSELPDAATLTIEGLRLPVDTYAANDIVDRLNKEFLTLGEPSCGDIEFLSFRELSEIGYQYPYTVDFTLSYEFDRPQQQLRINMQTQMPDMASVEADIEVNNMPSSPEQLLLAHEAYLSQLDVTYHNQGYIERVNNYCATQENLPLDEYIQQQVARPDASFALQWGVVPNQEIRSVYGEFLQQPESIHWRIAPGSGFNFNYLSLYDISDWPKVLHLEMNVNGKPLDIHGFSQPEAALGLLKQLGNEASSEPRTSTGQVDTGQPQQPADESGRLARLQVIPVNQLSGYIGQPVRITELSGKVREGYLKACDQQKARIAQRIHGGEYSVAVKLENIALAEVRK